MTDKAQNKISDDLLTDDTSTGEIAASSAQPNEVPDLLAKIAQRISENDSEEPAEAPAKTEEIDAFSNMRDRLEALKKQAGEARDEVSAQGPQEEKQEEARSELEQQETHQKAPRKTAASSFASVEAALSKLSNQVEDSGKTDSGKTNVAPTEMNSAEPQQQPAHPIARVETPSSVTDANETATKSSEVIEPAKAEAAESKAPESKKPELEKAESKEAVSTVPKNAEPLKAFNETEADAAWSGEEAEQLTAKCEEAGLDTGGRGKDDMLIGAGAAAATAAAASVGYVYLQPDSREIGQQWFEQRFESLSKHVDDVTSERAAGNEKTISTMLEKFDSLESRLASLLGEPTADGEPVSGGSLRDIELCIAELANQLDAATAGIGRIENVETQIDELSKTIVSQGGTAAGGASMFDVAAVADMVADRVAAKPLSLASGAPGQSGGAEGIGELSGVMKEFMRERRNEGEHANAILDTMQQTIIRVLDRMEALEASGSRQGAAIQGSAIQGAATPASKPSLTPAAKPADAAEASSAKQAAPEAPEAPAQLEAPASAAAPARPPAKARPAPAKRPAPATGEENVSLDRLKLAVGKLESSEPVRSRQAARPAEGASGNRSDFIASARQAAAGVGAGAAASLPDGELADIEPIENERSGLIASARQAASNASRRLVNDDDAHMDEIDATQDGFSLGGVDTRVPAPKKSNRTRLLVAAIALVAVGLGATKFMMSMSGEKAREQLQSNQTQQQGSNQLGQQQAPAANARTVGDVQPRAFVEKTSATPYGRGVQPGSASYGIQNAPIVQNAALAPQSATISNGQPVTGGEGRTARQSLPSAMVGPLSLRMAAANGDASAEFQVASRFADGKGVKQDFDAAHKWYRRSAARGFALSQYRLGTLYERGLGVDKDPQRARNWYERAARQDNIKAMHNLAVLSASSASGKPDYDTAARWFEEAASRGLADSQFNLAILYQNGLGVEMNESVAYKWFSLAAASGDNEALKRQLELANKLGKRTVRSIDRRVKGWLRKPADKMANDPYYAGQAWQRRKG